MPSNAELGQIKAERHVGERYGRLVIISTTPNKTNAGIRHYLCLCDCGNKKEVAISHLRDGHTRSCGCMQQENRIQSRLKHGHNGRGTRTRLYRIWGNMNSRCNDKENELYGGRGVTVCDEWAQDFSAFKAWAMANGYSDELSIDRIDVNGNYEPSNCRWATVKEQSRNKRNSRMLTYNGKTQTVADWADETSLTAHQIENRLLRGWKTEDIFERPIRSAAGNAGNVKQIHGKNVCPDCIAEMKAMR